MSGPTQFRPIPRIERETLQLLRSYSWPGNIRELRNVLEQAMLLSDDVVLTERQFEAVVPTPKFLVTDSAETPWPLGWQPPMVVKPVRQGSSVGLQFVNRVDEWHAALAESLRFDSEVLVEEKIIGRETTVGILGGKVLPTVEVRPRNGVYDAFSKYTVGATEYFCPADFDAAVTRRIQDAALGAFHAIGGRDYARVDVMVRADGSPVVLEVNTLPGFTSISMYPKMWEYTGIPFADLIERLIELALERHARRKATRFTR